MEKSILRILVTFTLGFLVIGAILGLVSVGDCGSVFSPDDGCGETLSLQRGLVIAFVGLGLTSMAAAIFADAGSVDSDAGEHASEEGELMEEPTRLERIIGVLAKAAGGLVAGGLIVLLANALVIDQKNVHIIGLGALRAGLLVILLIIVTVLVSVIVGKVRKAISDEAQRDA